VNYQYLRVVHKETLWLLWQWKLTSTFHTPLSWRDWSHFRIAWIWTSDELHFNLFWFIFSSCVLSFGWFPSAWIFQCRHFGTLCLSQVVWTCPHDLWQTECSETSALKIQTPGNHPKERIQHSQHGASLKSRIIFSSSLL